MNKDKEQVNPVDQLLARLTQQQDILTRQKQQLSENQADDGSSSGTDPYANTTPPESAETPDGRPDAAEVFRLKKELAFAQQRMAQMDLELTQSRITKHTVEEAIGSPFPAAQHLAFDIAQPGMLHGQNGFTGRVSPLHQNGQISSAVGSGIRLDTNMSGAGNIYTPQQ